MQISMSWLKKYIDLEDTPEVLGEKLTMAGIPVENIIPFHDDDAILEFELTANRGDCFSAVGLLREISLLTGKDVHLPKIEVQEDRGYETKNFLKINVEEKTLCKRFSARLLKNVRIFPSPQWLQDDLESAGIRPINNVVDVTNYVMLEFGQPLHSYDYDALMDHALTVRLSKKGEEIHTLDDGKKEATGRELVIADGKKVVGVAGVMGGKESEINENTTTVVLEAAVFSPVSVRKSAKYLNIHSEASTRFERGVDLKGTVRALDRAAQLLQIMGACKVAKGMLDVVTEKTRETCVPVTTQAINKRLGTNIELSTMTTILRKLGFIIREKGADLFEAVVPSWRHDIGLMEDLSEEVARIYGFDHIKATLPRGEICASLRNEKEKFISSLKLHLQQMGLSEVISFSFIEPKMFDILGFSEDDEKRKAIPILNPLSEEYPLVRTTLLGNILDVAVRNFAHKNEDLALFELGTVFLPKSLPLSDYPLEKLELVGLLTGKRSPMHFAGDYEAFDFYDAKGAVEEILSYFKIEDFTLERGKYPFLHEGKTAVFKKDGEILAFVGEIHPTVSQKLSITKPLYIFQIEVEKILEYMKDIVHYIPLPKYPAIKRDLAILVDKNVLARDLTTTIQKNAGSYLQKIQLFDVYEGERIASDKKSVAFNLYFQAKDRTLTDEEISLKIDDVIKALDSEFQASLR